jgi:alkylation response protein AidB-like acyl-CoA dehydrogenase
MLEFNSALRNWKNMNLSYSTEDIQFRKIIRDFVQSNLPEDISVKVADGKRIEKADIVRWQKILYKQGWGAIAWPTEYGGTGWTTVQQYIFEEECADACAPIQLPFGLKMVAPVIMAFGNQEQKATYLPRIISGEDWWCQGYSEPGSGSDLASLKTKAERQGDHYIVNGQKTWTTLGQYADWIFCLVRTNTEVRNQEGISFLLIDMKTPGITVRPIIMIDQEHEVNEVWFENVKVPIENLVGDENKGWTYAKYLLGHERTNIAQIGKSKRELKRLIRIAKQEKSNGKRLIDDIRFRDRIAHLQIELQALEITNLRVISNEGKKGPGPEASLLKIKGSEIQQLLTELQMQAVGHYALPHISEALNSSWKPDEGLSSYPAYAPALSGFYFNYRKTTIYGGSNEIQRNIISQMILGL